MKQGTLFNYQDEQEEGKDKNMTQVYGFESLTEVNATPLVVIPQVKKKEPERKRAKHTRPNRKPFLTARDIKVMTWVGEMYAVRFDLLSKILAAESGKAAELQKVQGQLAYANVVRIVSKWKDFGYAEYRRIVGDEPPYVWLTGKGLKEVGLTEYSYQPPSLSLIKHYHAVTLVRRYIEMRNPSIIWKSERALRGEVASFKAEERKGKHVTDGLFTLNLKEYAVEVELTRKGESRQKHIAYKLGKDYDRIYYFAKDELIKTIEAVTEDQAEKFDVVPLSRVTQEIGIDL